MGAMLRRLSHVVLSAAVSPVVQRAVDRTASEDRSVLEVELDRPLATQSMEEGRVSPSSSQCVFAQLSKALEAVPVHRLRCALDTKDRLFVVKYKGEQGLDWGGLYRDALSMAVENLFSMNPEVALFTATPAHRAHEEGTLSGDDQANHVGADEAFVPLPVDTDERAISFMRFVGVLMGISLRFKHFLDFKMHPMVWKLIVGENPTIQDLESVDHVVGKQLTRLMAWTPTEDQEGIGAAEGDGDAFRAAFPNLRFVDPADGRTPLVPEGQEIDVMPDSRQAYARLVLRRYTSHYRAATRAMREGLSLIVPDRAIAMTSARGLSSLVTGPDVVSVEQLKKHTRNLSGIEETDCYRFFWQIVEEMSNRERQMLIRFAWGRSKLPFGKAGWDPPGRSPIRFQLDKLRRAPVDSHIESHTCFFQILLPPSSSVDVLRVKLHESIVNGLRGGMHLL